MKTNIKEGEKMADKNSEGETYNYSNTTGTIISGDNNTIHYNAPENKVPKQLGSMMGVGDVTGDVKQTININKYPNILLILLIFVGGGILYWYIFDASKSVKIVGSNEKTTKKETINKEIKNIEKSSIAKEEKIEHTQIVKKKENKLLLNETSSCKDGKNGIRICFPINKKITEYPMQKITVYPIDSNK